VAAPLHQSNWDPLRRSVARVPLRWFVTPPAQTWSVPDPNDQTFLQAGVHSPAVKAHPTYGALAEKPPHWSRPISNPSGSRIPKTYKIIGCPFTVGQRSIPSREKISINRFKTHGMLYRFLRKLPRTPASSSRQFDEIKDMPGVGH